MNQNNWKYNNQHDGEKKLKTFSKSDEQFRKDVLEFKNLLSKLEESFHIKIETNEFANCIQFMHDNKHYTFATNWVKTRDLPQDEKHKVYKLNSRKDIYKAINNVLDNKEIAIQPKSQYIHIKIDRSRYNRFRDWEREDKAKYPEIINSPKQAQEQSKQFESFEEIVKHNFSK